MTANWIDVIIFGIMALSVVFGLWRGLLSAGFGILALIVGFFVAKDYAYILFPHIQVMLGKSPLVRPLSYVLLFISGLLAVNIISWIIRSSLQKMDFGGLDVFGGAVFGVLRGLVFCSLLLLLFSAVGIGKTAAWDKSATVPYVGKAMLIVMGLPVLAGYQKWLEFDKKNRPLVVDAGLLSTPSLEKVVTPAVEQTQEAIENISDNISPEDVFVDVDSDSENLEEQTTIQERLKHIKNLVSDDGSAGADAGESESIGKEELEQIRTLLKQKGAGADADALSNEELEQIQKIFTQASKAGN